VATPLRTLVPVSIKLSAILNVNITIAKFVTFICNSRCRYV